MSERARERWREKKIYLFEIVQAWLTFSLYFFSSFLSFCFQFTLNVNFLIFFCFEHTHVQNGQIHVFKWGEWLFEAKLRSNKSTRRVWPSQRECTKFWRRAVNAQFPIGRHGRRQLEHGDLVGLQTQPRLHGHYQPHESTRDPSLSFRLCKSPWQRHLRQGQTCQWQAYRKAGKFSLFEILI